MRRNLIISAMGLLILSIMALAYANIDPPKTPSDPDAAFHNACASMLIFDPYLYPLCKVYRK